MASRSAPSTSVRRVSFIDVSPLATVCRRQHTIVPCIAHGIPGRSRASRYDRARLLRRTDAETRNAKGNAVIGACGGSSAGRLCHRYRSERGRTEAAVGGEEYRPGSYKSDLIAFLRTYLNDPTTCPCCDGVAAAAQAGRAGRSLRGVRALDRRPQCRPEKASRPLCRASSIVFRRDEGQVIARPAGGSRMNFARTRVRAVSRAGKLDASARRLPQANASPRRRARDQPPRQPAAQVQKLKFASGSRSLDLEVLRG